MPARGADDAGRAVASRWTRQISLFAAEAAALQRQRMTAWTLPRSFDPALQPRGGISTGSSTLAGWVSAKWGRWPSSQRCRGDPYHSTPMGSPLTGRGMADLRPPRLGAREQGPHGRHRAAVHAQCAAGGRRWGRGWLARGRRRAGSAGAAMQGQGLALGCHSHHWNCSLPDGRTRWSCCSRARVAAEFGPISTAGARQVDPLAWLDWYRPVTAVHVRTSPWARMRWTAGATSARRDWPTWRHGEELHTVVIAGRQASPLHSPITVAILLQLTA
jgi:hypothetical protein